MKTNIKWYEYKDIGSYQKLDNGVMMFAPMHKGGGMSEDEAGETDWEMLKGESIYKRLRDIEVELQSKL